MTTEQQAKCWSMAEAVGAHQQRTGVRGALLYAVGNFPRDRTQLQVCETLVGVVVAYYLYALLPSVCIHLHGMWRGMWHYACKHSTKQQKGTTNNHTSQCAASSRAQHTLSDPERH